jgi:phosphohistidine swiveling domain-containing protein
MNLDRLRSLFDSIPGMTADDFERDICGEVRPDLPPEGKSNRLPFIVTKAPVAMATSGTKLRRFHAEQRVWWEREVRDRGTPGDPLARLVDAADRFERAFHLHVRERLVLMTVQAQLTKLAYSVERPDLVLQLLAGLGGVAETEVAEDLWEVSRGQLTVAEFVRRHGYHGPNEGNLTSHSWREDAAPVERLVAALAARPDSQRPRAREAAAIAARQNAIAELVALVPSRKRPEARWYCKVAVRAVQANELGKASYLMGIDGGRAATRDLGAGFVAGGRLDEADDAFYFTIEELQGGLPDNAREVVAHRRRLRDEHRAKELPITFTGMPQPVVASTATSDGDDEVRGLSGAAGVVQGRARVVLDPAAAEPLDEGEVLVCRFTDPSWTPLFLLASALVIDIGASASHGAIVARELGIPCVIGTGDGTRRIATGDLLSVDGSTGVVTISERAVAASGAER